MRCPNCDAVLPENGRFCIECGQPVTQTATGPTERLPEHTGGPRCSSCGTRNPPGAEFCVMCGSPLSARPVADPLPPPPAPAPTAPADVLPVVPARPAPVAGVPQPQRNPLASGGIGVGLFLIGLAVLAITDWWWPGILVLIGAIWLVGAIINNRLWVGLMGALWMFGIAVIAMFDWWWPGMLILAGLSVIAGALLGPRRHSW